MDEGPIPVPMQGDQDQRISEAIRLEWTRLRNFIRKRVTDPGDAEDILQDVFYELIEAYRLMKPVEQVGAWLFRVARNRITDRFRKKRPERSAIRWLASGNCSLWRTCFRRRRTGPRRLMRGAVLLDELEEAWKNFPKSSATVFVAHELDGRSFKEIAAETGVSVNTLLSRKRYAVLHLAPEAAGNLRRLYETSEERTMRSNGW